VSGKTGTIGYNVSIPEKPVQIWIFGDKQYWLQAVWGPTYVLAGPDPDYEPGQPFSLMIYVEEAPAQWTLAATAESPCFYEQGGMALVGEVLAVSCPSETHFYQWHAAEQLIKPLGTYVHETDWGIPEQFAALSSDLMLVRAGHGIEVLRISTWPPELIWNGYYDVTPNYDVNNHRLIEKMLFLPGGTATAAAVFDIDSPPDSEPIAKSPSWARTLDVRKGVAVTGDHLNGRGIHVYDVSGCWGD
jgi:hypothetical protein